MYKVLMLLSLFNLFAAISDVKASDEISPAAPLLYIFANDPALLEGEATITFEYYVTKKGNLRDVALYDSEGLENAQVNAIYSSFKKWKFKPASKDRKALESHMLTKYEVEREGEQLKLYELESYVLKN